MELATTEVASNSFKSMLIIEPAKALFQSLRMQAGRALQACLFTWHGFLQ